MNGFSGIINGTFGTGDKYRGDFLLNYRTEKFNYFIGADWRDETNYGSMASSRETYLGDTTKYLTLDGDRNFIRGGQNLKGGFDFYLSDKTTFTLSGEVGKSKTTARVKSLFMNIMFLNLLIFIQLTMKFRPGKAIFTVALLTFSINLKKTGTKLKLTHFTRAEMGLTVMLKMKC